MHTKSAYRINMAKAVICNEADSLRYLADRLSEPFSLAIDAIIQCKGRLVVTGIGKSGHIGRKIAATLSSTGTTAYFMHAAEAAHGDLGMIEMGDIVLALSNSGESAEVLALLPALKRKGVMLISMTGRPQSTLAKESDIHLHVCIEREACPLGLAPTSSTTAALALGDALAVTLLDEKGFREEDFALSHPGGSLGKRLLVRVLDVMRKGDDLPRVQENVSLKEALIEMTQKSLGMTAVVDEANQLTGIFTDGDLRRALDVSLDLRGLMVKDVMTPNPCTIEQHKMAVEAVRLMETRKINGLLVVDGQGKLVGALNMHVLLQAGVV